MADENTADLERRLEMLERKLARDERPGGVEAAFWALMHNVFPKEARIHMKAAGREQLLAARAYLDLWIAKLEEEQKSGNGSRRESIEIS